MKLKIVVAVPFHRFSISTPYLSLINFIPPFIDMYEFHVAYRITWKTPYFNKE